jgi:Fic family protein
MDDFIHTVNRIWESADAVTLAAFVLWRLNFIHPFINGNGRTARAASYFVLCVKANAWLPGTTILPELLRIHRDEYVKALVHADASAKNGALDLVPLHTLIVTLLEEQLAPFKQEEQQPPDAIAT